MAPGSELIAASSGKDRPGKHWQASGTYFFVDLLAHRFGHAAAELHRSSNCWKVERLVAVAQGRLGVGMDFDDQPVGAGGDGGGGHPRHQVRVARAVARIDHDRQVRALVQIRHRGQAAA